MTRRNLSHYGRENALILLIPVAGVASFLAFRSPAVTLIVVTALSAFAMFVIWKVSIGHADEISRLQRDHQQESDEHRKRWKTLQREAMQATTALSKMRDGVVMLSQAGEILLINPAARGLLNLSPQQDYLSRSFDEVVRVPELARVVALAGSTDRSQQLVLQIQTGDQIRPIQFRIDQVTSGPTNSLLMTLRDETEARRVDEIRREFVANISHELKTPLAAIKGYAETVELAIHDDPQAAVQFMSRINTQCLRLERLISDMMQLARAQAGREHLNFGTVRVSEVVAESLKAYRPIAKSEGVELLVDQQLVGTVHGDPEAMLTIANNLIGNAIQHTPHGGKVTISSHLDGTRCVLVVADTGVGIDQRDQDRIFERFYRVNRNRENADGGTGIGLSIVKNLVNTMDGEVTVASEPGAGATFEVRLPQAGQ